MPKEMTFTEAVRAAMMVCASSMRTIIELSRHPESGLWTVYYLYENDKTVYETILNKD